VSTKQNTFFSFKYEKEMQGLSNQLHPNNQQRREIKFRKTLVHSVAWNGVFFESQFSQIQVLGWNKFAPRGTEYI